LEPAGSFIFYWLAGLLPDDRYYNLFYAIFLRIIVVLPAGLLAAIYAAAVYRCVCRYPHTLRIMVWDGLITLAVSEGLF
jgi:hypothetical protein